MQKGRENVEKQVERERRKDISVRRLGVLPPFPFLCTSVLAHNMPNEKQWRQEPLTYLLLNIKEKNE